MEKVFNKKCFLLHQAVKCLVLAIVVSPWFVACGDEDPVVEPTPSVPDTPAPKDPVLDIAVGDTLFFSEKSDTKTLYIHCDTTFTVSFESNDWIKDITPGPLANIVYYRFSIDENTDDAVRSAKMTVKSVNGLTKSFVICQDCSTRVVSQEFFYANDFLGEENKVVLHLNRAVKSLTGSVISTWLYFDKPQITLHDDHRSLTISGISGIGANHTFVLGFGTIAQLKQSINYEVWGCDYHWKIEGLMAAQCLPAAYPDRHYVATTWP